MSSRHHAGTRVLVASALAGAIAVGCGNFEMTSGSRPPTETGQSPGGCGCVSSTSGTSCPCDGPGASFGGTGFPGSPTGPFGGASPPSFGATVTAITQPPPISGGTLIVARWDAGGGTRAIASDPDRDSIYVVDTRPLSLKYTIALQAGDEPGRLVEDGAGRVHVALRGSGALVTIDPSTGSVIARRPVCPAPRGVAWDAANDLVWVACATGELVALPSAGGGASRSFRVERDLRDVIVGPNGVLTVSKFRSAELLGVGAMDGTVRTRVGLSAVAGVSFAEARVAWRTMAGPSPGSVLSVFQTESTAPVLTSSPGGYGGGINGLPGIPVFRDDPDGGLVPPPLPPGIGADSIVSSELALLGSDGRAMAVQPLHSAVLPVDLAVSDDGSWTAVAVPGMALGPLPSVLVLRTPSAQAPLSTLPSGLLPGEEVTAVAFNGFGDLVVQSREPALMWVVTSSEVGGNLATTAIALSTVSRRDTGHDIFHVQAGGLIACASCHPEGGDDGHVWLLDGLARRTPSLRGTIAGTAPYHWPGDQANMGMLVDNVYTHRMSGMVLQPDQKASLTTWVEAIPAPPAPSWVDSSGAQRGKVLFEGTAGCVPCHSGPKLTDNSTRDVGTADIASPANDGGLLAHAFQVPPLVGVGWRTPLLHDGCAATLADRFGAKCSTTKHGSTSRLTAQDISDLTAYLETL
jgi:Cytochrome c